MKRLLTSAALFIVSWSAPLVGYAADPVGAAQTINAQVTVEAIDPVARIVTLKTQDGRLITTAVGANVQNLDKVKVGDIVTVTYTEAIAFWVRHPETEQEYGRDSPTAISAAEARRAGYAGEYGTLYTTVQAVDASSGLITFRGPQGQVRSIVVQDPKAREQLHKVKAGDVVDLRYSEAVAVVVEPAPGQ